MECVICYEKHVCITCQFCSACVCTECAKAYMLSSFQDPHCPAPTCLRGWSDEFMASKFTKSFLNGALTKHRQETWLERQRALLPTRQHLVPHARALRDAKQSMTSATAEFNAARNALNEFHDVRHCIRSTRSETLLDVCGDCNHRHYRACFTEGRECVLKRILAQHNNSMQEVEKVYNDTMRADLQTKMTLTYEHYMFIKHIYADAQANASRQPATAAPKEARAFVRACPVNECRGFLSTAWKCGVCSTWACSKCHEVKAAQHDPNHQCNPDNVASAAILAKETKPCPSCAAGIFKISGCDQMWCTSCNTGFDWKTGKRISTNRIHNPHFFEYASRAGIGGGGAAAGGAAAAGNGCFQGMRVIPGNPSLGALPFHNPEFSKAFNRAMHISDWVGTRYDRLAGRDSEQEHEELAVMFLMGDISEKVWKERLQRLEKRQRKYRAIHDVIRGYDLACGDVFQALASRQLGREEAIQHEAKLHDMLNEALKGVCRVYTCKMPKLSA